MPRRINTEKSFKVNKRTLIKYGAATLVFGALSIFHLSLRGVFDTAYSKAELFAILSDAFALPGIIGMMVFVLLWISSTGFFDMITYGVSIAGRSFIPGMRIYKDERYADYKKRKEKNRLTGYSFILFVGVVFTLLGMLFLVLCYKA